jgi:hypothetical protein
MGASFVVILFTGLLLIPVCKKTIQSPTAALAVAVLINLMLFSPVQWQNFLWAIQLIVFIPALAMVIIMIAIGSGTAFWLSIPIAAAAAVVATYSNSNGMVVWALAIPFILVHPSKFRMRGLGVWLFLTAVVLGWYFHDYVKMPYHPSMALPFRNPWQATRFLMAFVGNGIHVTWDFDTAVLVGMVPTAIWLLGILVISVLGRDIQLWRKSLPWIMLGAYSIASGILATLGRFGFGPSASMASRYPTFAVPMWFCIVPLWMVISAHFLPKKSWFELFSNVIAAIAGVAVAAVTIYGCVFSEVEILAFNARMLAGRASEQFALVVADDDAANSTISGGAWFSNMIIRQMDQADLFHPQCFHTNDIAQIAVNPPGDDIPGYLEYMGVEGNTLRFAGWASLPPRKSPADAVLLTTPDAAGVERVIAIGYDDRLDRPDVSKFFKKKWLGKSGWSRTVNLGMFPHGAVVSAWAYDTYSRRAYRLRLTQKVP